MLIHLECGTDEFCHVYVDLFFGGKYVGELDFLISKDGTERFQEKSEKENKISSTEFKLEAHQHPQRCLRRHS